MASQVPLSNFTIQDCDYPTGGGFFTGTLFGFVVYGVVYWRWRCRPFRLQARRSEIIHHEQHNTANRC